MAQLVLESERAWQALGEVTYGATESERKSLQFRRSLYVTEDLSPGDALTAGNLRAIRPGLGLPPKYLPELLGKRVNQHIRRGMPFSWSMIG
jgi:N-acetylneuraminate synthase